MLLFMNKLYNFVTMLWYKTNFPIICSIFAIWAICPKCKSRYFNLKCCYDKWRCYKGAWRCTSSRSIIRESPVFSFFSLKIRRRKNHQTSENISVEVIRAWRQLLSNWPEYKFNFHWLLKNLQFSVFVNSLGVMSI